MTPSWKGSRVPLPEKAKESGASSKPLNVPTVPANWGRVAGSHLPPPVLL